MLIHLILFYGGLAFSIIAALAAIIAAFILKAYKKRLKQILDREYGAKH